jgi:hypothetical protein
MMDLARNFATAASNACSPILFEPIVISSLLGQWEKLEELEEKFNVLVAKRQGFKVTELNKP